MGKRSVLILCAFVAACSHPGSDDAFRWTNTLDSGAVVHIRNGAGDIRVEPSNGQSVVVSGSRTWRRGHARDIRFVVEQRGKDYYVCAMWRNSGHCANGNYRGRNTGGFLSMFSLFHRSSDATAAFVVELPASIGVDVRTGTGSVEVTGATAGVTAHTVNGGVTASNVSGPIDLGTTNGDVQLSAAALAPTDPVKLNTTNGSVKAELPPGVEGKFDLSTVNGQVESDLPLPATTNSHIGRHFAGQIGTADRMVKMRTINGMVTVTTRGVPASSGR